MFLLPEDLLLKYFPVSGHLQVSLLSVTLYKVTVGTTGGTCGKLQLGHTIRKTFSAASKPLLQEITCLKKCLVLNGSLRVEKRAVAITHALLKRLGKAGLKIQSGMSSL